MALTGRPVALVVHGDGEVLDLLTRWFEQSGFDVLTAVSAFRAQSSLGGVRDIDVVIAAWDAERPVGGELYRWALGHRPDLRTRFVFIADDVPAEFDAVVGGRCLAVPLTAVEELVRIANAAVVRTRTPPRGLPIVTDRPSLLLADDDPALLATMAELLHASGYAVFQADSSAQTIAALATREFDAIVIDWRMHDGSGGYVYRWLVEHKPQLTRRVVFLAEAEGDDPGQVAPGRPMVRKGQDSKALAELLREIVAARAEM